MNVGKIIYGYCDGFCGDSLNNKIIIFETEKSIVYRFIEGNFDGLGVVNFDNEEEKNRYIKEWSVE